jgi:hypothetical protein
MGTRRGGRPAIGEEEETMRRFREVLVILAVAVVTGQGSGVARAQNFGTAPEQQFFRVESQPARGKGDRLLVRGYVYNLSPYDVGNLRLGVEAVDASGGATGAPSMGWVNGDIPKNGRRYFELPVASPAPTYRVTVQSFDIRSFEATR